MEWWNIPRRGWIIILGELAVIITLGSWVYAEYLNNSYFQSYVNSLSPILVSIVSVGFGIASATVATLLYFTMRKVKQRERPGEEEQSRKRGLAKKTIRKPQISPSRSERSAAGGLTAVQRSKLLNAGSLSPKRAASQESRDEEDESD